MKKVTKKQPVSMGALAEAAQVTYKYDGPNSVRVLGELAAAKVAKMAREKGHTCQSYITSEHDPLSRKDWYFLWLID